MCKLGFCKATPFVFLLFILLSTTVSAQQFTTLAFKGANGGNPVYSVLVQGPDGALYGTGRFGGGNQCSAQGCGSVFKITTAGKLTTVYNFCAKPDCPEGWGPWGGLVLAKDGNFYGTTTNGGRCGQKGMTCGTIFKLTPKGHLTVLYSFCSLSDCADGAGPVGALIQGPDGNFYGTTSAGGIQSDYCMNGCGTIFRMTPSGQLTTMYILTLPDSAVPYGGLVLGSDGNFYGTTTEGGDNGPGCMDTPGCGTIFRVTPAGEFTTIHYFCSTDCSDGDFPGGLVLAADGMFYGVAEGGGQGEQGTFFSITPGGQFTTIYKFCHELNCTDGSYPAGTLIQATDGNFYGVTGQGGNIPDCPGGWGCGVVFSITPNGTETVLHIFTGADGQYPSGGLTQATTGDLFGTAFTGGITDPSCWSQGCGTLFKISSGLGPFVRLVRNPAKVGEVFGILGQGLAGASSVSLNGTPAKFEVRSGTLVTAIVPPGAKTGFVTVATLNGTLTSNVPFKVIP